jgi:hypothetical protein
LLAPSPSGGGGSGSYYIPTGLNTADTNWQNLDNFLTQTYTNNDLGQYGLQSLYGGLNANSAYAPAYQTAANNAGTGYTNAGSSLTSLGNLDLATQQQLLGAGQQVYQMGLDPQSALYDRTVQQLQDQTGATNSMYGLGSSAAGAGVANQALSNFNIDWQNNQLSRALQGLQGYTGAATTAGQYGQAGGNALTLAPQYTLYGGQVPYQTGQSIAATPGTLGNTYGSFLNSNLYGPGEGMQGQIIPYLNYGAGAQSVPFQSQAQGAGAAGSLVSQGIQGIGNNSQVQSAFSNFFNGGNSYGAQNATGYNVGSASPYYSGGGNTYGFTLQ